MEHENCERRMSPRVTAAASVQLAGVEHRVANISVEGFAVRDAVWFEHPVPVILHFPLGGFVYSLARRVGSCYVDARRPLAGFEFLDAGVVETDILLGLILSAGSGAAMPLAVARANRQALRRLSQCGEAECVAGSWHAAAEGLAFSAG